MLDLIFCLPILVGCPTKIKSEGSLHPRVCPLCHNASVQSAKSRRWFEFCFVPLIPMKAKRIWVCAVCHWTTPIQEGWQPEVAGSQQYPPENQGLMAGMMSPPAGAFQPGYQPQYINQNQKSM